MVVLVVLVVAMIVTRVVVQELVVVIVVVMKKVVMAPGHKVIVDLKIKKLPATNATMQRPSIGKSREKEKLLFAGSCYGGDLRRPGPRSQESKEEKIYIFKEESCLCQLMRQYGLNNLRRSQQKIFLASQIGETPSLDALVTF